MEVANPLEAAAKSEAAAFFLTFNATEWVEGLGVNFSTGNTVRLRRVARALHTTITTPQIGHYISLGALLLFLLHEALVRMSAHRVLKRIHAD